MCEHLLRAGYSLSISTRTPSRARNLVEQGATWVATPAQVTAASDIVFTMVGMPSDVREVYFGEAGLLRGARAGMVFIDMTTTEPSLAVEIAEAATRAGAAGVDAPVSGGDVGARNAALSIMVGGEPAVVEAIRPLLALLGKNIVHQGAPGAGQHAKMCNQIVAAGNMIGMCEALLYAQKSGLNLETMLTSVRGGAANSWLLENLAPRILAGNFNPGFFVEHFVKDLSIALDESRGMNLPLPGVHLAHQLYLATQAQGHGRLGTQSLLLALERLAGGQAFAEKRDDALRRG